MFGVKRKKSPAELVKSCQNQIKTLTEKKDDPKSYKKALEKLTTNLSNMKLMLYGDGTAEAKNENVNKLSEEILKADLFQQFVENMKDFEFEARKDVAQVLNGVMRHQKNPSLDYLKERPEILHVLVNGYSDPEVALNCGIILREVLRFKEINEILLHSKLFDQFFIYVQLSTFDIASDAFLTFKMLLTKHDTLSAKFCDTHYEMVFTQLNSLLESKNFVTKRQSLKLLSELLLSRSHLAVRVRYVNDANNLKLIMNLLRCSIKAVQYEAFHVFKIFVANPKKGPGVVSILIHNRERLIEFFKTFPN